MDCKSCKDCLHYELCRYNTFQEAHYFGKDKEIYITIDNNSPCKYFADRSEWVHLPCVEGTKVYKVENNTYACYDCSSYDVYNECCEYKNIDCPLTAKSPVCSRHYLEVVTCDADKDFILHHINDFGKIVFLTREEAEKALEEKK